jgi:probable F420-dependent oxidoreductase
MGVAVGLGLFEFPFSSGASFWRWVDLCEAGGIDSIWQSDRISGPLPMLECMSTMAALAGGTKRLKFGMFVASVGLRDPLLLAKQCATIDVLSDGRLLPAFGVGNPRSDDWLATATETRRSGRRADDALDIIGSLLRGESVTFDGEFHRYHEASISPLPVQNRIPLWIGGHSRAAMRRTARVGTGWVGGTQPPEATATVVQGIKSELIVSGRTIDDDHYGAGLSFRFGDVEEQVVVNELERLSAYTPGRDSRSAIAVGTKENIVQRLREFVAAGVSKFVLRPIGSGEDDLIAQTKLLIEQVIPEVPALNPPAQKATPRNE